MYTTSALGIANDANITEILREAGPQVCQCEEAGTGGGRVPNPTRCHDGQTLNRGPPQCQHRPTGSPSHRRRPLLAPWATGTTMTTRRLGKSPAANTNTIGGPSR